MKTAHHVHHEIGRILWSKPAVSAALAALGTFVGHLLAPGSLPL